MLPDHRTPHETSFDLSQHTRHSTAQSPYCPIIHHSVTPPSATPLPHHPSLCYPTTHHSITPPSITLLPHHHAITPPSITLLPHHSSLHYPAIHHLLPHHPSLKHMGCTNSPWRPTVWSGWSVGWPIGLCGELKEVEAGRGGEGGEGARGGRCGLK